MYGLTAGEIRDLDVKSAYPVALSLLQYPKYKALEQIPQQTGQALIAAKGWGLVTSYSALKVQFRFPIGTKFPNISVRLGEGSVAYPLSGVGYCTGLELYYAVTALACEVTVLGGYLIPFFSSKGEAAEASARAEEREFARLTGESKVGKKSKGEKEVDFFDLVSGLRGQLLEISDDTKRTVEKSTMELKVLSNFEWLSVTFKAGIPSAAEGVHLNGTDCLPVWREGDKIEGALDPSEEALTRATSVKSSTYDESHGFEGGEFYGVIDELLKRRNRYKVGTYSNLLYKFICNAGIGAMGRGLNHKLV